MENYIKGDQLIFYVYDGSAYRPVACLTSNSLSEARNVIESQTKCAPGQTQRDSGSYTYEIAVEGQYIDTTSTGGATTKASHDYLHNIIVAGTAVTWKMDTGLTDTVAYYGTGVLSDLVLDAPAASEIATFTGTLSGSELVTTTDPNA